MDLGAVCLVCVRIVREDIVIAACAQRERMLGVGLDLESCPTVTPATLDNTYIGPT